MSGPSWVTCTGEANLTARLPGGRQVRGKTRMAVDQRVGQATPAPCGTSDVSRSIAVRVRPPRNTGLSILTFRMVLVLRDIEEMSTEETAAHLGLRPETVKTRLHRARRLLRQSLDRTLSSAVRDVFPCAGARCARITEAVLDRLGIDA